MLRSIFRAYAYVAFVSLLTMPQLACSRGDTADAPPSDAAEPEAPGMVAPAPEATGGATAPTDAASSVRTVPQGTSMTFVVGQTVSSGEHPAGHTFTSRLDAPAVGVDGRVVLPEGAVGRWIVTESMSNDGGGQALLAVRLEAVQLDGEWHPVHATVTSAELQTDARDSGGETAVKIGIGAAAGALAGRILGGSTKSTLKGAGVGAAMGTVVALSTRGGSVSLKEGSRITVRLDDQLVLG